MLAGIIMELEQNETPEQYLELIKDKNRDQEEREQALRKLIAQYTTQQKTQEITQLVERVDELAPSSSKIYIAKLLKVILDEVGDKDNEDKNVENEVAYHILQWAEKEKKQFLINKMKLHYANVLYQRKEFRKSRKEVKEVLESAKQIDDKRLSVEAHLLEAKLIYETHNYAKAKASLTASRASANLIHIPQVLQADIEFTAGIIHLAERDFQIAYSYFYEAFEAYHQSKLQKQASQIFSYMVLSKIMQDALGEAENLLTGRYGLIYTEKTNKTKLIRDIQKAYKRKSVVALTEILQSQKTLIKKDLIINDQIDYLYDQLIEKNILNLIKPYSKVQIGFLADKLKVSNDIVEKKISQMILDKKLFGSLDQENGILISQEENKVEPLYTDSLEIISNMEEVMDSLFERAKKIKSF